MGRQSTEAKLVVLRGGLARRPEPPTSLNEAQAKVWRETAASEALTFFDTAALRAMLVDYCRHTVTAEEMSALIDKYDLAQVMDDDTAKLLDRLTKMRDRETKAAADKATKLRLTNQSRYTPKAAGTASKNGSSNLKPWEIGQ
jgi:hypothetical protein